MSRLPGIQPGGGKRGLADQDLAGSGLRGQAGGDIDIVAQGGEVGGPVLVAAHDPHEGQAGVNADPDRR